MSQQQSTAAAAPAPLLPYSEEVQRALLPLQASLDALTPSLRPPVNNRMLFDGALKVMAVGGGQANERRDFHIETGAELFYQRRGHMDVLIVDPSPSPDPSNPDKPPSRLKHVWIREGELFYLPPGVPHSPQRFADTLGIVLERERHESECDALRWYDEAQEVLYAEYFHCKDLGSEIKNAIFRFREFLENPLPLPPVPEFANGLLECMEKVKGVKLREPFNLQEALNNAPQGISNIVEEEFVMSAFKGICRKTIDFPAFVKECYIWQFSGSCQVIPDGQEAVRVENGDVYLVTQRDVNGAASIEIVTENPEDVSLVIYNIFSV